MQRDYGAGLIETELFVAEVAVKEGVSEHEKDLSGPAPLHLLGERRGSRGWHGKPHRTNINETSASPRAKRAACGF